MARPIPWLAPVTTATRSLSRILAPPSESPAGAGEIGPQRLRRARERQLVPRHGVGRKDPRLERFVPAGEAPADGVGGVHHDDHRPARVRVNIDEAREADLETDLLARLAHRRLLERLPAVHVPAREDPAPVPGLDAAPQEHD